MNALIVDDDRFVVAALTKGIHWEELGFEQVYQAYSMEQARQMITGHGVDLLLSDIDMPHGSGLDLLRWVRDHHSIVPCIFLTNYADFEYAQEAVNLKCYHYFLKSVDYDRLSDVIRSAVEETRSSRSQKSWQYLTFWRSFGVTSKIPEDTGCPYRDNPYLLAGYLKFYPWYLSSDLSLHSRLDDQAIQRVRQIFESLVPSANEDGALIMEDVPGSNRCLLILPVTAPSAQTDLTIALDEFQKTVAHRLHCPVNLYLGRIRPVTEQGTELAGLKEIMRNDLDGQGRLVLASDFVMPEDHFLPPDGELLQQLLNEDRFDELSRQCHNYLGHLSATHTLSQKSLGSFQIDIVQALYSHLARKGLLANRLYSGETYHTISENAGQSLDSMEMYLGYIFSIAAENIRSSSSEKDVVQIIKDYVDRHYMEDIGRESLESILYFDPDYASRLFKNETGISFMSYVIEKRISEAKSLLASSTLPVSTIASRVGYDNYSYFTRLFKKETGITPIKYRQSLHHDTGM